MQAGWCHQWDVGGVVWWMCGVSQSHGTPCAGDDDHRVVVQVDWDLQQLVVGGLTWGQRFAWMRDWSWHMQWTATSGQWSFGIVIVSLNGLTGDAGLMMHMCVTVGSSIVTCLPAGCMLLLAAALHCALKLATDYCC